MKQSIAMILGVRVPAAALTLLLLTACGPRGNAVTCDQLATGVTYGNQVQPMLEKHCVSCHASSKSNPIARRRAPADINFDSYDSAKSHAKEGAQEMESGSMPPAEARDSDVSDADRCLLRAWMSNGSVQ